MDPLLKHSSDPADPNRSDLSRLLSLLINLLETAESLHLCFICNTITEVIPHHLCRSKFLLTTTLKSRGLCKNVGHEGHLKILPTRLADQHYRMTECKLARDSVRPVHKIGLSGIEDRLASWSVPFSSLCLSAHQHSSPLVLFLLDSSVINPSLEFKSSFD